MNVSIDDRFWDGLSERTERAHNILCVSGLERFEAIKSYYELVTPLILKTPSYQWAIDPCEVVWDAIFTPIESALWSDIREEGAVMYPQYPVAGYFVDFGSPIARVAIECDGKAYHQDKAKDRERDSHLRAKGWTVHRLTGSECLEASREYFDFDGIEHFKASAGRKLLKTLCSEYAMSPRFSRRFAA